MCDSILEFDQSWNFFHQLYNYSKKYFMRPNKIYIFRISSTRSIKCRDLRNFLEFKKIEVIKIFKKRIFCLLKNLTKIFTPFCRSRRADS